MMVLPQITSRDFVPMAAITAALARLGNATRLGGRERRRNATGRSMEYRDVQKKSGPEN
jgi:hypothetical protein